MPTDPINFKLYIAALVLSVVYTLNEYGLVDNVKIASGVVPVDASIILYVIAAQLAERVYVQVNSELDNIVVDALFTV